MRITSIEKDQFKSIRLHEPNAATIGISCDDWYCHKPGMTRDEVCITMQQKKFDIVPIVNKSGIVKSFFTLNENKVAEISKLNISLSDTIYYLTHIKDVIWLLNKNQRRHYFLSNYENKEIIGLISLSNLNCREFNLYLFGMLALVEKELSNLISSSESSAIGYLEKIFTDKEGASQLHVIKRRLRDDKKQNIENDFKEYLYIHHLVQLVVKEKKYMNLGYKNEADFVKHTKTIKTLRNSIAHPVRSLVKDFTDLETLQVGLNKLYELKYKIESH